MAPDIPINPQRQIRAGVGVLARFVERRLAARHGWDLVLLRGERPLFPGSRASTAFRVVNPGAYFRPGGSRIASLHVSEWLRFGNSINQLVHVLDAAEALGVRDIHLPGPNPYFRGEVRGLDLHWGRDGSASDIAPSIGADLGLLSLFLHPHALNHRLEAPAKRRHLATIAQSLLIPELRRVDERVGPDDLVMYFRAGDVFSDLDVHPGYGQPPVSFFVRAVELEKPRRVWLVFEDRGNPAIAAVEQAVRARGIEVVLQSGTAIEDIRVLASARRLVSGLSTFAWGAAMLFDRLDVLYAFASPPPDIFAAKGARVVTLRDRRGDYQAAVLAINWAATPEQTALMLTYPIEAIGDDLPPA